MADNNDEVLRRSLDAVDRSRKWLMGGIVLLLALLVLIFLHGAAGRFDSTHAILAHYFMLLIWVTMLALVIIIQITVMTKRILRAIELASRK